MAEKYMYVPGEGVDYTFSARLDIPDGQELNRGKVLDRLVRHALKTADPHLPIIGGVIGEGSSDVRKEILFGLDPSKTWGTPEREDYREFVNHISRTEGWVNQIEAIPAARIPLGRRREYDESNGELTMEEVEEMLKKSGRQALRVTAADLFSIRYIPRMGHPVMYHEPGAFIDLSAVQFAEGALDDVLAVAEQMDQDRVVPSITGIRTQVYERRATEDEAVFDEDPS